ncbi:MAG: tripartite tricarboxylate transporter substrate binding protein [Herminiimonas sp.]|nr:tripartite tricarboxylate transporter substrate binding protein [Herminiimonas sp.]
MTKNKIRITLAAAALSIVSSAAWAQYPSQPITLVVPFPAGGTNDIIARTLSAGMSRELKQSVIVESRSGAGGNIGAQYVARAKPDGYTLLVTTAGPLSINSTLYANAGYDPVKSFAPIALLAQVPIMLVANPDAPFKTLPEMLSYAKANPGKVFYGSQGNGTTSHLTMELLKVKADVKLEHVPYKGSAPAATDLMGGAIQVMFDNSPTTLPLVRGNRLRALAVAAKTRVKGMEEIPAISETIKDFESAAWFAIVAPAGTPPETIARLNTVVNQVLAQPEVREKFAASGVELVGGPPQDLAKQISTELVKWAQVIKYANIKID